MWSCAMAGLHTLEGCHHAGAAPESVLREDGFISRFMEQTGCHRMKPADEPAPGSTRWLPANPGAYTYDYTGPTGGKGMQPGVYDLLWFDTGDGGMLKQSGVDVAGQ